MCLINTHQEEKTNVVTAVTAKNNTFFIKIKILMIYYELIHLSYKSANSLYRKVLRIFCSTSKLLTFKAI